ncbi:protein of unknown function [Cyanobium sp. NIES-981]|nr:protein of unknown function [Cyanobium sp. NIES-981]
MVKPGGRDGFAQVANALPREWAQL